MSYITITERIDSGHYNNDINYIQDKKAWIEKRNNILGEFKKDLEEELGTKHLPRKPEMFYFV